MTFWNSSKEKYNSPFLKDAILQLMLKNRRKHGKFQYTVPSPYTYPYQWLWDSCFHAIILSYFDMEDAKKELLALFSHQFSNGMLPHMIYWDKTTKTDFPVIAWGKEDTSTITQPPIIAYAVWRMYQKDHDTSFLHKVYSGLKNYYIYLLKERDSHHHHLVSIINPDESGEDNSPRFDTPLALPEQQTIQANFKRRVELIDKNKSCNFELGTCMRNFFWVKDIPFNVIMIESLDKLSFLAKELRYTKDAEYFSQQKSSMHKAMKKYMYEESIFWTTYGNDYKKIKTKTWAIFAPLFAKLYSKEDAQKVIASHLENSTEFSLPYLLPTVAKDEKSFDPKGFWRGSVWMGINWIVYHGLKNYHMDGYAQKIAQSSIALLKKSGFREYYNPLTGKGMGANYFTWGGLVLDMLE